MVKAPTLGQMAGNMSGHGRKTEQLGRAFSLIQMDGNILGHSGIINSKA